MAEGRMLKKKISTDVEVADLENPWYILLFTWGIAHLDIEGRITGNSREYKALVTPLLDKITRKTVEGFFRKATEIGLIQHYQVNGKWAAQFPGFKKNQSLRPDKEGASLYPPPPELGSTSGPVPDDPGSTSGPVPDDSGSTPGVREENEKTNISNVLDITPGALPDYSGTTPAEVKGKEVKEKEVKEINKPAENSAGVISNPKKPIKTPLPENFGISDRVRQWAESKGYTHLEQHLEAFKIICKSNGYLKVDWDATFMNAIRGNWGKINISPPAGRTARNVETLKRFMGEPDG